jgi:hypothetical protein
VLAVCEGVQTVEARVLSFMDGVASCCGEDGSAKADIPAVAHGRARVSSGRPNKTERRAAGKGRAAGAGLAHPQSRPRTPEGRAPSRLRTLASRAGGASQDEHRRGSGRWSRSPAVASSAHGRGHWPCAPAMPPPRRVASASLLLASPSWHASLPSPRTWWTA